MMCVKVSFIPAAAADAGVGAPAAFRSKLGESSMTATASLRFSSSIRDAGGQGSIPAVQPLMVSNIEMDTDGAQVWLSSCNHMAMLIEAHDSTRADLTWHQIVSFTATLRRSCTVNRSAVQERQHPYSFHAAAAFTCHAQSA